MPPGAWTMKRELLIALALLSAAPAHAYTSTAVTVPTVADSTTRELPATLMRPDGAGPFPAVVIMHDCSGLGFHSSGAPARWGNVIANEGYVALIPDSFGPRGFPDGTCRSNLTPQQRATVGIYARAADAYAALAYLRSLDFIDGKRVAVMGGSHGGLTTLAAMFEPLPNGPLAQEKQNGFAAAVALYPDCGVRYGAWSVTRANGERGPVTSYSGVYKPIAPLLILIGEKDDWTPAAPCQALAERSRQAGHPVSIKVYPGALHSFDGNNPPFYDRFRSNINKADGKGATTGGDSSAWADAITQVKAFFQEHLAQR